MEYTHDGEVSAWSSHFNKMAQGLIAPSQEYYTLSDPNQTARGPPLRWTYPTSQAVALAESSLNMLQPQPRSQSTPRKQRGQTRRKTTKPRVRKPQQKGHSKRKPTTKRTQVKRLQTKNKPRRGRPKKKVKNAI